MMVNSSFFSTNEHAYNITCLISTAPALKLNSPRSRSEADGQRQAYAGNEIFEEELQQGVGEANDVLLLPADFQAESCRRL